MTNKMKFKAVLSTTVLPLDGVYEITTLPPGEIPDITGVPHYIGHPATKAIVESLGAIPADTKLFAGLQPYTGFGSVREVAVCFPIAQGKSIRATEGKTIPDQDVDLSDLSVRVITRLDSGQRCPYCGTPSIGHYCAGCGVG